MKTIIYAAAMWATFVGSCVLYRTAADRRERQLPQVAAVMSFVLALYFTLKAIWWS